MEIREVIRRWPAGVHQCHNLIVGVGSAWPIAQVEVLLYHLGQAEMLGRGGGKE